MITKTACKILLLLVLLVGLVACSSTTRHNDSHDSGNVPSEQAENLPDGNLWDDFSDNLKISVDGGSKEIAKQIRWWRGYQEYLNHVIINSKPYIYYTYQETQKLNLPAELALIPIDESGYNPFLSSRTGATGLWQFMPGTASGFGLKINKWYDGRRDVVASTQAALKYITYLHYYFNNDWLLAIAAYNAGEGRVQAAILHNQRRNLPTDFWSLPLPQDTKIYVPKLLALVAIISDPEKYGIQLHPINNGPYFEQVDVGSAIDLHRAAKLARVNFSTMRALNPGLRRLATSPSGPYTILVPKDASDTFRDALHIEK